MNHSFDTKILTANAGDANFSFAYMHGEHPEVHSHDFWEFMIVTSGVIAHKINGIQRELKPNTVCLMRPNDVHCLCAFKEQPQSNIDICVRDRTFRELLNIFDADLYAELLIPLYIEIEVPQNTTKYALDIAYKLQSVDKSDPLYRRLTSLLFLDLFRNMLRDFSVKQTSDAYPAPIRELIKLMYDVENITCSLEELCERINFSQFHLIRQFQKYLKITPVRFFQNIKVNHARVLLETTDLSIFEIIEKIGLSNIEHFYNIFKKAYGIPPAKYRKNWHAYYNSFNDV